MNVQSALNEYQSQCSLSRDDRWIATVCSRTSLWGFSISGLLVKLVLHRIVSSEVLAGTEIPGDIRRRGEGEREGERGRERGRERERDKDRDRDKD